MITAEIKLYDEPKPVTYTYNYSGYSKKDISQEDLNKKIQEFYDKKYKLGTKYKNSWGGTVILDSLIHDATKANHRPYNDDIEFIVCTVTNQSYTFTSIYDLAMLDTFTEVIE